MSVLDTIAILLEKKPAKIGKQNSARQLDDSLSIVLDASVTETHSSTAEITSHPVESGVNIVDHVRRQPDSITITGIVSNTPTRFPQGVVGVAAVRSVQNLIKGVTNDLAKTAYEQLLELIEGKQLVKIVTTLREYNDMLLENISVTRDVTYGDSLYFTCTARQVRLIKTSSVAVKAVPAPKEPKKAVKKSLGVQSKEPAVPEERARSHLAPAAPYVIKVFQ
jgi:hypothetical protein